MTAFSFSLSSLRVMVSVTRRKAKVLTKSTGRCSISRVVIEVQINGTPGLSEKSIG